MIEILNDIGTFDQIKGKTEPDFLSPRARYNTLAHLKNVVKRRLELQNRGLQEEEGVLADVRLNLATHVANRAYTQGQIAELEQRRVAYGDIDALLREQAGLIGQIWYVEYQIRFQESFIVAIGNIIAALEALEDAIDMGQALLVLGRRLNLDPEMADEQPHWMKDISMLHQGVWEYFWTWPDEFI